MNGQTSPGRWRPNLPLGTVRAEVLARMNANKAMQTPRQKPRAEEPSPRMPPVQAATQATPPRAQQPGPVRIHVADPALQVHGPYEEVIPCDELDLHGLLALHTRLNDRLLQLKVEIRTLYANNSPKNTEILEEIGRKNLAWQDIQTDMASVQERIAHLQELASPAASNTSM